MVNHSTIINKTNNQISRQLVEHQNNQISRQLAEHKNNQISRQLSRQISRQPVEHKRRPRYMTLEINVLTWDRRICGGLKHVNVIPTL